MGDLVLKASRHIQKGLSALKFAPNWEGPFVILKAFDGSYYLISLPASEKLLATIHAKWLKLNYP